MANVSTRNLHSVEFPFDRTKAIEAILYLANGIPEPDKYGICKLLYLVDKTCLEKYGRFTFGESYYALKGGLRLPGHMIF